MDGIDPRAIVPATGLILGLQSKLIRFNWIVASFLTLLRVPITTRRPKYLFRVRGFS